MAEEIKCPHCGASIEDVVNDEKTKQSNLKDLYKRYQECRDAELKRFWEDSKYIWVFMAVCFTAYGFLMSKILEQGCSINHYHFVFSVAISIVGLILSYLWFKMAKSLKCWYEVFENAIWEMESYANVFNFDSKYLIHNYWTTKEQENNLSSPSKIVIHISILLIIFWTCAIIFSLFFVKHFDLQYVATVCTLCIFTSYIIYCLCDNRIDSSTLRNKSEENVFKQIKADIIDSNEHLYFEIQKNNNSKYVVFKFNEINADKTQTIYSLYGEPYEFNNLEMKYKYSDIEDYYKKQKSELQNIIAKIRNNETLKCKAMIQKKNYCIIFTSDPDNDLKEINESLKIKDAYKSQTIQDKNIILIPLKSNII